MKAKLLIKRGAAVALLIIEAICDLHYWQSRPIAVGPAGPLMPAGLFSRTWSEKQFLLIGMGDSVTAGFGARHGYSYFDRLVSNPPDESADMNGVSLRTVLPHLQSTNLAVSGSTSGQHIERQLPRLPGV